MDNNQNCLINSEATHKTGFRMDTVKQMYCSRQFDINHVK